MPHESRITTESPPPYPDAAIQMLRIVQAHHVQLSQMADHKASVLIGATSVVFSITIGQVTKQGLTLPFLTLGFTTFVAAAVGVLSILPTTRLMRGPDANILFFGAFVDLNESEFKARMTAILEDERAIAQALLREIYQMGVVLHTKKYRYLSAAYRVFLVGLIVTFSLFVSQGLVLPRL